MATETFFSIVISLMKNKCAHVYTTGRFTFVPPMKDLTGNTIGDSLWNLYNQFGIPDQIIADLDKAQEGVKKNSRLQSGSFELSSTGLRKDNFRRTTRLKGGSICLSANGRS